MDGGWSITHFTPNRDGNGYSHGIRMSPMKPFLSVFNVWANKRFGLRSNDFTNDSMFRLSSFDIGGGGGERVAISVGARYAVVTQAAKHAKIRRNFILR